ncbi:hypothetical protein [Pelovirga terrestris]|uniref:Uncharacterized protein n=1 Tax=Pelovirga terrestris TaxID=2771352 RepID=A0A8J6QXH7_9BACT|nr:hypothetical protein [Pelovirga terrestris]MBD1400317.1 hypothetical protein [Pelovirga terrestris]
MAAKVIPIKKSQAQIEQIIDEALAKHPPDQNPEVINCLKTELEKIIETYFIEDVPEISLKLPSDLTQQQFDEIKKGLGQLVDCYNQQMLERSSLVFRDLYRAKLEICRLRHQYQAMDN